MRAKIQADEIKIQAEQKFEQAKAKWKRVAFKDKQLDENFVNNIENEDI